MEATAKSIQDAILEAEEAHRVADLTISTGEHLLERLKRIRTLIENQIQRATGDGRAPEAKSD